MVEQLLDLMAVAAGAVGVPTGARMHQQRHRARHLPVALVALGVSHARRGLIDLPRVRLQMQSEFLTCYQPSAGLELQLAMEYLPH